MPNLEDELFVSPGEIILRPGESMENIQFLISGDEELVTVGLALSGVEPGDTGTSPSPQVIIDNELPISGVEGPGSWPIVVSRGAGISEDKIITIERVDYVLGTQPTFTEVFFEWTIAETCG